MKKLPIGIQTFSQLINENYLYVDKTKEIYKLFSNGGKYYFLSRPRRFGKSLLISTLREIFSGNKELFKDLWIYKKIEWKKHPVIHIDFSGLRYGSKKELIDTIGYLIDENAHKHQLVLREKGYDKRFKELIIELSKKERVVILIDEYDKPIIDFVDKREIALENRDILKNFYTIIKASDEYIKFVFITGVSKFSKVSVFSGLNNLRDITLSKKLPTLLGYTKAELHHYFNENINEMSEELGIKSQELKEKIDKWYNGYSWDGEHFVYNPFSILNLFTENTFDNFWFTSGTPSFLIKLIRKYNVRIEELEDYGTDGSLFESYDIDRMNAISLLFQTGYLTIKKIKNLSITRRYYYLSFPNIEVKESLLKHILADFSGKFPNEIGNNL